MSGKTQEFLFSPNASAAEITQHVYDHWPEGGFKSMNVSQELCNGGWGCIFALDAAKN